MLEDKIRGLDQFRLVMLVNRAQAQNWLPWIDSLVAQNRGTLLGGINCLQFRNYNCANGPWESNKETWELYIFEGGDQPLGTALDRDGLHFSLHNLMGRKPNALKPFINLSPPLPDWSPG